MSKRELATKLTTLNEETVKKLERWFVLFERHLAKAETEERLIDLKELTGFSKTLAEVVALTAAIEKHLEEEEDEDNEGPIVDSEDIRRLLSGEG